MNDTDPTASAGAAARVELCRHESASTKGTKMAAGWEALEQAARRLAPPDATLTHLCSGGSSTTFQVQSREGDPYALKVIEALSPRFGRSDEEFAALLRVDHPHVVPYLDAGKVTADATSYWWLTMAFVDGVSLRDHLELSPTHDLTDLVTMLRDAIAGAAALWAANIAHRDLSPENMIVTPAGRLVIVDLGMPRLLRHPLAPRMPTSGTIGWMSPEQIAADTTPGDWRSDQYVLGLLGYLLMTGSELTPAPNRGDTAAAELGRHHPTGRHAAIPALLRGVITTMLASRPQDRWRDSVALLAAVDTVAASLKPGQRPAHDHANDRSIHCEPRAEAPRSVLHTHAPTGREKRQGAPP